jgi:hypothetical protein
MPTDEGRMGGRFHINRDLLAGLMFIGWGAFGLWVGREYPSGSLLRMGPGYMPWMLCWGLVLVGAGVAVKGALAGGEGLSRWHLRPLLLITGAISAFALLIVPAGLLPAALAIVLIGALAGPEFRTLEAIALAAVLAGVAIALFVYGLKLPMNVLPV